MPASSFTDIAGAALKPSPWRGNWQKDGIPVLLTIQVDSISRIRQNDRVIPANVAQAANFYQPNGLLHGQSEIRAADPTRTPHHREFSIRLQSEPLQLRTVSLV